MRLKGHAFYRDLAQAAQVENLEPDGIRENRARPVHELVEAAELANGLVPGTQIQVVGVPQDDFGVEIVEQIARQQAFDSSLRANGYEHRGLDVAMAGVQDSCSGSGVLTGGLHFKT